MIKDIKNIENILDFLLEPLPSPKPILILTFDEIYRGVKSPIDVIERALKVIRETHNLNAFITVLEEDALKRANELENALRNNQPVGPLAGIPVSVKDNIFTKGIRTTMASKLFKDYVPNFSATVINKLIENDAIIIGKTNLHEFASGVTNISSYFGPARNPNDPERIPGGSSGGSAISVAVGSALFSIGTDTSGSVRIPAALCGVVGFKPSYGLISRYGVFPLAWSLDTVGILANTVLDAAYAFTVLIGPDGYDKTIHGEFQVNLPFIKNGVNPRKTMLGYLRLNEENPVNKVFMDVVSRLDSEGFIIKEIKLDLDRINNVHRIIRLTEAAAVHSELFNMRQADYSPDVAEMIRQGLSITAVDYINALRQRALIINEIMRILNNVDALLMPTLPTTAPKISEVLGKELDFRVVATRYVASANLLGSPAITIPMGKVDSLPVGLQVMGGIYQDNFILSLANTIENILKLGKI